MNFRIAAADSLYDYLTKGSTSTPLSPSLPPTVNQRLLSSVDENWRHEAEAVGDFLRTRAGRRIDRAIVSSALYLASETPWRYIRFGSKLGARLVPVIGWGLLAYDLYVLGDELIY